MTRPLRSIRSLRLSPPTQRALEEHGIFYAEQACPLWLLDEARGEVASILGAGADELERALGPTAAALKDRGLESWQPALGLRAQPENARVLGTGVGGAPRWADAFWETVASRIDEDLVPVDLNAEWGAPARSQGSRPTCVAFSGALLARYVTGIEVGERTSEGFSPQWAYAWCKEKDGAPTVGGTYLSTFGEVAQDPGLVWESAWPYNPHPTPGSEGQGPPPSETESAQKVRLGANLAVPDYFMETPERVVRTIRALLAGDRKIGLLQTPIHIGLDLYSSVLGAFFTGLVPLTKGRLLGGHALAVTGVGLHRGMWWVLADNSWGPAWGSLCPFGPGRGRQCFPLPYMARGFGRPELRVQFTTRQETVLEKKLKVKIERPREFSGAPLERRLEISRCHNRRQAMKTLAIALVSLGIAATPLAYGGLPEFGSLAGVREYGAATGVAVLLFACGAAGVLRLAALAAACGAGIGLGPVASKLGLRQMVSRLLEHVTAAPVAGILGQVACLTAVAGAALVVSLWGARQIRTACPWIRLADLSGGIAAGVVGFAALVLHLGVEGAAGTGIEYFARVFELIQFGMR